MAMVMMMKIDAFPNDITEWIDSDGDGVGNNADALPCRPRKECSRTKSNNDANTKTKSTKIVQIPNP